MFDCVTGNESGSRKGEGDINRFTCFMLVDRHTTWILFFLAHLSTSSKSINRSLHPSTCKT